MNFIDFFAGIGGMRLGFEMAGHRCIGFCECDKYAIKSYVAMHNILGEWFSNDIRKLKSDDIPYADIWTFGFPCQDISVAGKQGGLNGKRSGLYFKVIDLVKGKEENDKPQWLVAENVKNLLSINGGWDFLSVLSEMDEAGYDVWWQLLNSKDYGVPQNRERVFLIGHLRSRGRREILSISRENTATLKQIIGGCQGERVYDASGVSCTLVGGAGGVGAKTGLYFMDQSTKKTEITDVSRCITARYTAGVVNRTAQNSAVLEVYPILTPERKEKRQNGRRIKNAGEPMFTLTGQDRHGVAISKNNYVNKKYKEFAEKNGYIPKFFNPYNCSEINEIAPSCTTQSGSSTSSASVLISKNYHIRRLTPRECFRLQGFPDDYFDRAREVNSDSQLYKQAGNAVTVNVAFVVAGMINGSEQIAGTD